MALFTSYLCSFLFLIPLVLAATLSEVISQEPELSVLWSGIRELPADAIENINSITGATFLAPSNDALEAWIPTIDPNSLTPAFYESFVRYHFLASALKSTDLSAAGGVVSETALSTTPYAILGGSANVVYASAYGSTGQDALGALEVYSGAGTAAGIIKPDLEYDGGLVHVIDHVLNLPLTGTKTVEDLGLSVAAGILQANNLTTLFNTTPKITSFLPTDAAFAVADIAYNAIDVLSYHVIVGDVRYSTALEDGQDYQTLLGVPVTVHKQDGQLLIDDVPVERGNVIVANGALHVLGGVLTPPPTDSEPTQGQEQG